MRDGHARARLARTRRSNLSGFVEPFDTWADMSHLIPEESWTRPRASRSPTSAACCPTPRRRTASSPSSSTRRSASGCATTRSASSTATSARCGRTPRRAGRRLPLGPARVGGRRGREAAARRARFDTQFWTANVNPTDRYTLSLPGSIAYRISPLDMTLRQPDDRRRLDGDRPRHRLRRVGGHVRPARGARALARARRSRTSSATTIREATMADGDEAPATSRRARTGRTRATGEPIATRGRRARPTRRGSHEDSRPPAVGASRRRRGAAGRRGARRRHRVYGDRRVHAARPEAAAGHERRRDDMSDDERSAAAVPAHGGPMAPPAAPWMQLMRMWTDWRWSSLHARGAADACAARRGCSRPVPRRRAVGAAAPSRAPSARGAGQRRRRSTAEGRRSISGAECRAARRSARSSRCARRRRCAVDGRVLDPCAPRQRDQSPVHRAPDDQPAGAYCGAIRRRCRPAERGPLQRRGPVSASYGSRRDGHRVDASPRRSSFRRCCASTATRRAPCSSTTCPTREPRRYLYDLVADYPRRGGRELPPEPLHRDRARVRRPLDAALRTAVSIELMHNAMLIHDDIEDESEERRGQPDAARDRRRAHRDQRRRHALAARHAAAARQPPHARARARRSRILEETERMARESAEGQALELGWRRDNVTDVAEADYLEMVLKKTCWLTTIHPSRVGALIGARRTRRPRPLHPLRLLPRRRVPDPGRPAQPRRRRARATARSSTATSARASAR